MDIKEKLLDRLNKLIAMGEPLRKSGVDGGTEDRAHFEECEGWIAAAVNVTFLVLPDPRDVYRVQLENASSAMNYSGRLNLAVGTMTELLKHVRDDFESGLLSSIVDQTRAEVFDDFLDHARAYLDKGQKNQAGVIAGVVFEDTVRRIAAKYESIAVSGAKLDNLITDLVRVEAMSGAVAKRARAAAHVRTKATHADWREFEKGDVEAAIELTDTLILKHLAA